MEEIKNAFWETLGGMGALFKSYFKEYSEWETDLPMNMRNDNNIIDEYLQNTEPLLWLRYAFAWDVRSKFPDGEFDPAAWKRTNNMWERKVVSNKYYVDKDVRRLLSQTNKDVVFDNIDTCTFPGQYFGYKRTERYMPMLFKLIFKDACIDEDEHEDDDVEVFRIDRSLKGLTVVGKIDLDAIPNSKTKAVPQNDTEHKQLTAVEINSTKNAMNKQLHLAYTKWQHIVAEWSKKCKYPEYNEEAHKMRKAVEFVRCEIKKKIDVIAGDNDKNNSTCDTIHSMLKELDDTLAKKIEILNAEIAVKDELQKSIDSNVMIMNRGKMNSNLLSFAPDISKQLSKKGYIKAVMCKTKDDHLVIRCKKLDPTDKEGNIRITNRNGGMHASIPSASFCKYIRNKYGLNDTDEFLFEIKHSEFAEDIRIKIVNIKTTK